MNDSSRRAPVPGTPVPGTPVPGTPVPEPWQPRFTLSQMLLIMLISCVMAGELYYLLQIGRGRHYQVMFVILTCSAPGFVFIAASIIRLVVLWKRSRLRRR